MKRALEMLTAALERISTHLCGSSDAGDGGRLAPAISKTETGAPPGPGSLRPLREGWERLSSHTLLQCDGLGTSIRHGIRTAEFGYQRIKGMYDSVACSDCAGPAGVFAPTPPPADSSPSRQVAADVPPGWREYPSSPVQAERAVTHVPHGEADHLSRCALVRRLDAIEANRLLAYTRQQQARDTAASPETEAGNRERARDVARRLASIRMANATRDEKAELIKEAIDDAERRGREAALPAEAREAIRPHACHWPDCPRQVPPAMWGCREHWFRLPADLRREIWATYRPGQEQDGRPSLDYIQVAEEVQYWIRTGKRYAPSPADEKGPVKP